MKWILKLEEGVKTYYILSKVLLFIVVLIYICLCSSWFYFIEAKKMEIAEANLWMLLCIILVLSPLIRRQIQRRKTKRLLKPPMKRLHGSQVYFSSKALGVLIFSILGLTAGLLYLAN